MIDVLYLSMHTSPLLQPGSGYAGGMNVYIHELALTMSDRNVNVTVVTRRVDPDQPEVISVNDRYRVVHVDAGPAEAIPMSEMPGYVLSFTEATLRYVRDNDIHPHVIHSHYWLSGWAGALLKQTLDVPLANSFHTLGRIKDITRRSDEPPSSELRTITEEDVIARSDCVIASTPFEFDDLVDHYGASPERLCTSPPGVDHEMFSPGDQRDARIRLGWDPDRPIVLFVGRIQPLKAADVAVATMAELGHLDPLPHLAIIGGPSGPAGAAEVERLHAMTAQLDIVDRVMFLGTRAHDSLPDYYRAADVLIVPSRSESFGLVAAEAQACGTPVVAARVGGLPYAVNHEHSGLLVDGHDPAGYAKAIASILSDPDTAHSLREGAVKFAARFSWPATAERLLELYEGIQ